VSCTFTHDTAKHRAQRHRHRRRHAPGKPPSGTQDCAPSVRFHVYVQESPSRWRSSLKAPWNVSPLGYVALALQQHNRRHSSEQAFEPTTKRRDNVRSSCLYILPTVRSLSTLGSLQGFPHVVLQSIHNHRTRSGDFSSHWLSMESTTHLLDFIIVSHFARGETKSVKPRQESL